MPKQRKGRRKVKKHSGFFYRKFRVRGTDRTFESGKYKDTDTDKIKAQERADGWRKTGHFARVTSEKGIGKEKGKDVHRVWVMIDTKSTPTRKRTPQEKTRSGKRKK